MGVNMCQEMQNMQKCRKIWGNGGFLLGADIRLCHEISAFPGIAIAEEGGVVLKLSPPPNINSRVTGWSSKRIAINLIFSGCIANKVV